MSLRAHLKLTRLMLTRGCPFDDPIAGPVRRARRVRWLLTLTCLALYAAAIWTAWRDDTPAPIDPRAYHCDPTESLPCIQFRSPTMSIRPIIDTLREIRHGAMLDEAAAELAEVVKRVAESGRPGSLTMKLIVKPAGRGSVRTVMLEDAVVAKLPPTNKEVTVFFPTEDGNLSRNDPTQMDLGLRPVKSGAPGADDTQAFA